MYDHIGTELLSQLRVVLRPSDGCRNERLPLPCLILILPFITGTPRGASPLDFFSSTGTVFRGVGLTTEKQGHKRGCRGVDHTHRISHLGSPPLSCLMAIGHALQHMVQASLPCFGPGDASAFWHNRDRKGKCLSRNCTSNQRPRGVYASSTGVTHAAHLAGSVTA